MIVIRNFQGEAPKIAASMLTDSHAQTANGAKLWSGFLRALKEALSINTPSKVGTKKSIFRWNPTPGADAQAAITAANQTNPVQIVSNGHGRTTGDRVFITGVVGMTEINDLTFTITVINANMFSLDGIDGTAYTAYVSGGTWVFENGFWFHWTADVDAVRGPVAGDTLAKTYYTGDGVPKMTYSGIATSGGTDYPMASYDLGLPAPVAKPTAVKAAAVTGTITGATQADPVVITDAAHGRSTGDKIKITGIVGMTELNNRSFFITKLDANTFELDDEDGTGYTAYSSGGTWKLTCDRTDKRDTAYIFTYVSGQGEEGPPSLPSAVVTNICPGRQVDLSDLLVAPAGNFDITHKRVYRAVTSGVGTQYQFVVELPIATTTYSDTLLDSALGEALQTEGWAQPPADMAGMTVLANGIAAGFSKNELCLSEPYLPHAWPVAYRKSTDYPIIGLAHFDISVVIGTTEEPYIATGNHPASMQFRKLSWRQGCVSKRSMKSLGDAGVIYASADGLVVIGLGGINVITNGLFSRDEWQAFNPPSMEGYVWDNRYYCFYTKTDGTTGGFYIDPEHIDRGVVFLDTFATAGYQDLLDDRLYLQIGNQIKHFDGGATKQSYTWKSKLFLEGLPKTYTAGRVFADSYSSLTMTLYADVYHDENMVEIHTEQVQSDAPFRLPDGYRARRLEVKLKGTDDVHSVVLAGSVAELANAA